MPPRRLAWAALSLAALLAWPALCRAQPPTLQERDAIEDFLLFNFVYPQTSIWQFGDTKPYIGSQTLVCGKVNFQSAMRSYGGFKRFYAALDHGRVTVAQIDNPYEDVSGRLAAKLDLLCGKA